MNHGLSLADVSGRLLILMTSYGSYSATSWRVVSVDRKSNTLDLCNARGVVATNSWPAIYAALESGVMSVQ